jgi:hypothetical protein
LATVRTAISVQKPKISSSSTRLSGARSGWLSTPPMAAWKMVGVAAFTRQE